MTFKPIGSQILVELEENKPVGEILLPDSSETFDFSMFVVREVGQGHLTHSGWIPLCVAVGDRVKLRGSAKGNMVALEGWFVNDRKLAVVDISHVAGVWQGEIPSPKLMRKLVTSNGKPALAGMPN